MDKQAGGLAKFVSGLRDSAMRFPLSKAAPSTFRPRPVPDPQSMSAGRHLLAGGALATPVLAASVPAGMGLKALVDQLPQPAPAAAPQALPRGSAPAPDTATPLTAGGLPDAGGEAEPPAPSDNRPNPVTGSGLVQDTKALAGDVGQHLVNYAPHYMGGLVSLYALYKLLQRRKNPPPEIWLSTPKTANLAMFCEKHAFVVGFLRHCSEQGDTLDAALVKAGQACQLDAAVAEEFNAAFGAGFDKAAVSPGHEGPMIFSGLSAAAAKPQLTTPTPPTPSSGSSLGGDMLRNAGRFGAGLVRSAAGGLGTALTASPRPGPMQRQLHTDSANLARTGMQDMAQSLGLKGLDATRTPGSASGNFMESVRQRPGVTPLTAGISRGAERVGLGAGMGAAGLVGAGALGSTLGTTAVTPANATSTALAGGRELVENTAFNAGVDAITPAAPEPASPDAAALSQGPPGEAPAVPAQAPAAQPVTANQPPQVDPLTELDMAAGQVDPAANPEQAQQLALDGLNTATGGQPEQVLETAKAFANGQAGPEQQAKAIETLSKSAPPETPPEGLLAQFSAMPPEQQALLSLGLGMGAIGLINTLAGEGGIGSWLMTLLGLGGAAAMGANAGMFGQGAQQTVQGLGAAGQDLLGGVGGQIAGMLGMGGQPPAPPADPTAIRNELSPMNLQAPGLRPTSPIRPAAPATQDQAIRQNAGNPNIPPPTGQPDFLAQIMADGKIGPDEATSVLQNPQQRAELLQMSNAQLAPLLQNIQQNDPNGWGANIAKLQSRWIPTSLKQQQLAARGLSPQESQRLLGLVNSLPQ